MSGEYREHQPSEALKPFVDCFWARVGWPGLETRVLPDGAVDIIFDLAAPSPPMAALVVGTMTAPVVVEPPRTCDYVAVRFHPGGAQPLFGSSMQELSDHREDLGSMWSSQVASEWTERLKETESTPAASGSLSAFSSDESRGACLPNQGPRGGSPYQAVRRVISRRTIELYPRTVTSASDPPLRFSTSE